MDFLRVLLVKLIIVLKQVCASVNLAEEVKTPKLIAETTWNLEI